jgi:hypothetical protein
MNTQERTIEKTTFRIPAIAVAAVAVLVLAAYLFGIGLRAGTPVSLASSAAVDPSQDEWLGLTSPEAHGTSSPAVDPHQDEWLGLTSSQSVGAKWLVRGDSVADPSTSIKPEGVKASETVDSASGQYPWIKPEGIRASGAR